MSATDAMRLQEVDLIPSELAEGVLYVADEFATAAHLCCCGCGAKVVTPLGPGRWTLTVDHQGPSLSPSVGNTSQACRSHYLIIRGTVHWATQMTDEAHNAAIASDQRALDEALALPGLWGRLAQWIRERVARLKRWLPRR